ncbi:MAG: hypothetical protein ACRD9S_12025 [Pyrinomonadaceae bacterium]
MRNINCRNIRRDIEEARSADFLSAAARSHLEVCAACETLSRQQIRLRAILSSLETVEAPADFDYRVRSRLAAEKRAGTRVLPFLNLSFGLGSAAVAAMLLLIGSAFVFVSFKARPDTPVAGGKVVAPKPVTPESGGGNPIPVNGVKTPDAVQLAGMTGNEPRPVGPGRRAVRAPGARKEFAALRTGKRVGTFDQTQTGAAVDRLSDSYPTAAFPINASYQSLKVSVDDSRGASRTISLPSVSFGSQRTLSQTASPLIASARDTW